MTPSIAAGLRPFVVHFLSMTINDAEEEFYQVFMFAVEGDAKSTSPPEFTKNKPRSGWDGTVHNSKC